jgi:hypothetical protein
MSDHWGNVSAQVDRCKGPGQRRRDREEKGEEGKVCKEGETAERRGWYVVVDATLHHNVHKYMQNCV